MKTTIKGALNCDDIEYSDFYSALEDLGIGFWEGINSKDIIEQYLAEMIHKGIRVSHIVRALEEDDSECDDWAIWLGNSMETPTPINSKQDLVDALGLDDNDLEKTVEFEL